MKKYKVFEADYYGYDNDDTDWYDGKKSTYKSYKSASYYGQNYYGDSLGKPKKPKLVSIQPYIKYLKLKDVVYHDVYGRGIIGEINTDLDYKTLLIVIFDSASVRSFRAEEDEYLKIEDSYAQKLKKSSEEKSEPVEQKEETLEDWKNKAKEFEKKYRIEKLGFNSLTKDLDQKRADIENFKHTIDKVNKRNQELQKKLDEYEGLIDAMKEFKGKVDPFEEETWAKKKK